MTPIKFKEMNVTFAENQPEYLPLPAHKGQGGEVISCWKLSWGERLKILLSGRIWLSVYTFNTPLQPLLPTAENPFKGDTK